MKKTASKRISEKTGETGETGETGKKERKTGDSKPPENAASFNLPLELEGGLTLRWAEPADAEKVAEFNGLIHSSTAQPDEPIEIWTRDLFRGDHPTTGPGDFTVVTDQEGKIISTMNLISQTWAYEGIPFGMGRPELVGTLLDYRQQGLVRKQFEAIHARSASRGELMTAITGIPFYYRQFGYEMALDLGAGRRFYWANVSPLPKDQPERFKIRLAVREDSGLISQLYAIHCSTNLISRVRSEAEWLYELEGPTKKSAYQHNFYIIEEIQKDSRSETPVPGGNSPQTPVETGPGIPTGYFEMGFFPKSIVLRELAVLSGVSLRDVAEFVTRALKNLADEESQAQKREKPHEFISFALGKDHPVYTALGSQLEKPFPGYAWYTRIPNLPQFIRHISLALEKRLENSVVAGHSGTLRLNFYNSRMAITFSKGHLTEVGNFQPTHYGEGDASFPGLSFLQLLLGFRNLEELNTAFPDCFCRSVRASVLLTALFPKKPSSVAALG